MCIPRRILALSLLPPTSAACTMPEDIEHWAARANLALRFGVDWDFGGQSPEPSEAPPSSAVPAGSAAP